MGNNVDHMNESHSNQNSLDLDNLGRFIQAQNEVDYGYEQAKKEITKGKKVSHWIWYIFPQIKSLGSSINVKKYGIADFAEACNYLRNKTLFQRYMELVLLVKKHLESQVPLINFMGVPDDTKLISSITLFHGIALFLQQQYPKANYKDLADCCGEILNLASLQNYPPCQATLNFLKISKERISKVHVNTVKSQSSSEAELEKRLIPETLIPEILEDNSLTILEKNTDQKQLIDIPQTPVESLDLASHNSEQETSKLKEQFRKFQQVLSNLSLDFTKEGHDPAYFEKFITPYINVHSEQDLLSLLDKDRELHRKHYPHTSQHVQIWLVIALKHPNLNHDTLHQCATKLEMPNHNLSYQAALLGNIKFFKYLMDNHQILEEPGFSNFIPAISGAIRGNNIELLQLLQRSKPHEFAKLNPDELLEKAISSGSMDLLEYILQNFKTTMPNLLQYKNNWLYHLAARAGQMQALKYLEAIALKEGGFEKLSALRGHRNFEPFRFGAPNVQEYFLSDKTFFEALYSSGYFGKISFPLRYELLQKARLSEQEILNDAAIIGNLDYFDYLTQTEHLLKHPKKADQPFLLAAEHNHLVLLQSLHKQIPLEHIKQIIVVDNYQIITRLLNQQEDYGSYSSMGRASNSLIKDPTPVLNWFQEIMPELKPKIESIIRANQESKKIQIKGNEVIANLLAACEGYQVHLLNQNKETSKELLNKKINILAGLIKILRDSKVTDPTFKIEQFKSQLEQNINYLKEKRSPKWLQFIETIAHILSLTLYSKLKKNTCRFWKSHGDLFAENTQEIVENKDSAPSKKM